MATIDAEATETAHFAARALAVPLRLVARLAGLLEPWLLLLTRVWLAQAFLSLQLASMMATGHDLSATLGEAWWVDIFRQVAASGFGAAIQAICPLLLIVGLAVRPASVLMLIQVLLLQQGRATLHVFWVVLLVGLVVRGAGRLSVEAVFVRGASDSALPGVRMVGAIHRWLDRVATPVLLLMLRLVVAAALMFRSGATPMLHDAMQAPMLHAAMAMVPATPGLAAALPAVVIVASALAMIVGVGVRPVAFLLLLLAPIGSATIASDTLYWLLLLGFLVIDGAGALAVDPWLDRRLRGMIPAPRMGAHHVVIVGGGFGGCAVARGLGGRDCHVTLIDRHNYHLFQPLLYQVATAGLSPSDIATPIRGMFRDYANIRVRLGTVTGVDPAAKVVEIGAHRIGYDTLVLASGARHAYFGRDEWSTLAPGLKTIDDATAVRRRLLIAFEEAEAAQDEAERTAWQTFVVVGGGPTGVELAGAIAELARTGMTGDFRSVDPTASRVVLVQSAPRLLPAFPEELSIEAAAALRRLGVEVLLEDKATMIDAGGVTTQHGFIPARSVLWAAGVQASPAARWLGAEADRAGRVVVGPDLRVPGHVDVFAIGDTCASDAWDGKPVPGLAPAAKQAGGYVARAIRAGLRGRSAPAPFAYRHQGSLATIGRQAAVADFGRIRVKGALAWWLWGAVHVLFLIDGRSRAGVVVEWLWDYLTLRRGTRLITGEQPILDQRNTARP